jgi:hypothetical protein
MNIREEAKNLEQQLHQLDQRIASDSANRLRAEGALKVLKLQISEEDALPKLKEV